MLQWKLCNFPIRIRLAVSENKKLLSNLQLKKHCDILLRPISRYVIPNRNIIIMKLRNRYASVFSPIYKTQKFIGYSRPILLSMGKDRKQSKFFYILRFHGDKVQNTLRKEKQNKKKNQDISMRQLIYLLLNIFP